MDKNAAILKKLIPHLCIAEWSKAGAETIMRDIVTSAENKLPAISALPEFMPVLNALPNGIRVFLFTDDANKLADMAPQGNAAVQFFTPINKIDSLKGKPDIEIIPAFALKEIEHLDWNRVIFAANRINAAGFMFIDSNGKNLHRFYDFLNIIGGKFAGEIHYCAGTNDIVKLDAARRLVEKVRPNMLSKLRLFVTRDFFKNLDNDRNSV